MMSAEGVALLHRWMEEVWSRRRGAPTTSSTWRCSSAPWRRTPCRSCWWD